MSEVLNPEDVEFRGGKWVRKDPAPTPAGAAGGKKRGQAKGNKFGARATTYNGVRYDSRAEARFAQKLDLLVAAGEVAYWLGQPRVQLGRIGAYRPDFLVWPHPSAGGGGGGAYFVDVKGCEPKEFAWIRKLWPVHGPGLLVLVKADGTREEIAGGAPAGVLGGGIRDPATGNREEAACSG